MKKWIAVLFLSFFWGFSYGEEYHYVIEPETKSLSLVHRYFYSTQTEVLSLDEVLNNNELFQYTNQRALHIGNFKDIAWIKIHLVNQSPHQKFVFEFKETYVDSLRFYIVKDGMMIKELPRKGLYFPENNDRQYLSANPSYTYDLAIPQNDTVSLYMRCIINQGTLQVAHQLWTKEAFELRRDEIRFETTYLWLSIGFSLMVVVIALIFYVFTRDLVQLYYVGFILSNIGNIILMADFFSAKTFESYFFFGTNYSDVFGLMQIFFGLKYMAEFLQVRDKLPFTNKLIKVIVWVTIVNTVFTLFFRQYDLIHRLTFYLITYKLLLAALISFGIAIYLVIKKDLMARYFLIAYLPLFYFVGHYFAIIMGLTERERTLSWELVIFFEIFVLTLAMAHRYYLIGQKNIEYQKTINRQQKDQLKHIISAQEQERKRLAQELHDGVVQEIGSVILGLKSLNGNNGGSPADTDILVEHLENSNRGLRTLSHNMMPKTLTDLGIIPALKQMFESSLRYSGIKYEFEYFNFEHRLEQSLEVTLYRIAQELVNNMIKHSGAKNTTIQLYVVEGDIMMVFSDDGEGIKIDAIEEVLGMRNVRSRLEIVNGTISYNNNEPNGTVAMVKIPLTIVNQKDYEGLNS